TGLRSSCSSRLARAAGRSRAQEARRVARVDARAGDVARDDRTGADHDVVADGDRQQGRVRPDRDAVADPGCAPSLALAARRAAFGKRVVDEHDAVADEAVAADLDQLADERVRLDPGARADDGAALDLDERADEAVIPQCALVDVGRLDDADALAAANVAYARGEQGR